MNCNCKKVKYGSEAAALADIKRIQKSSDRTKIPTRAYQCASGAWHLTSRPDIKQIILQLKESEEENASLRKQLEQYQNAEKRESLKLLKKDEMVRAYKQQMNRTNTKYRKLFKEHKDLIGRHAMLQAKLDKK